MQTKSFKPLLFSFVGGVAVTVLLKTPVVNNHLSAIVTGQETNELINTRVIQVVKIRYPEFTSEVIKDGIQFNFKSNGDQNDALNIATVLGAAFQQVVPNKLITVNYHIDGKIIRIIVKYK